MAASPTPHAEILNQCVPILAEQGIELVVNEYSDYVVPNTAVEDGDEDANYFQHLPYLEEFNETRGTHLVSVAGVHIEPMGIYAGRVRVPGGSARRRQSLPCPMTPPMRAAPCCCWKPRV